MKMKWISVKDRLPETVPVELKEGANLILMGDNYLVVTRNSHGKAIVTDALYSYCPRKKAYKWRGSWKNIEVTHWMPFPGPPVEATP